MLIGHKVTLKKSRKERLKGIEYQRERGERERECMWWTSLRKIRRTCDSMHITCIYRRSAVWELGGKKRKKKSYLCNRQYIYKYNVQIAPSAVSIFSLSLSFLLSFFSFSPWHILWVGLLVAAWEKDIISRRALCPLRSNRPAGQISSDAIIYFSTWLLRPLLCIYPADESKKYI